MKLKVSTLLVVAIALLLPVNPASAQHFGTGSHPLGHRGLYGHGGHGHAGSWFHFHRWQGGHLCGDGCRRFMNWLGMHHTPEPIYGVGPTVAPIVLPAPQSSEVYAPQSLPVYVPEEGAVIVDNISPLGGLPCDRCGPRDWEHRSSLYAEYLYLRARDAEVAYAAPVDGAVAPIPAPGNQVGSIGVVDPDYDSAYRVGFWWAWDHCTSLGVGYTRFETNSSNSIGAQPADSVLALVTHPGVNNARNNWLQAHANLDMDFELIDANYRWLFAFDEGYTVNFLAGARYGRLEENFRAAFADGGARTVDTEITFDGGGIRLGAEAERFAECSGWMAYGKSNLSLLVGEFRGTYVQNSAIFGGGTEIATSWKAGRVVPILELEVGVGWRSCEDRLRLRAGYLYTAWLNTVRTDEFIESVQNNSFVGLGGDTLTFDGLVARAEWRF